MLKLQILLSALGAACGIAMEYVTKQNTCALAIMIIYGIIAMIYEAIP